MNSIQPRTLIPTLTHYLTENHLEIAKKNESYSTFFKVAMVISAIGALLIFSGVTAMYLGLLGELSLPNVALLGCMIASCLSMKGVDVCAKWHVMTMRQAKWYRTIAEQLKSITHWKEETVRQFFTVRNKSIDRLQPSTMSMLQKINAAHPLLALLPLIARYQLTENYATQWNQKAQEQLHVMQHIDRFPSDARGSVLQIHQALLANANSEKEHCEQILQNYLWLVI